MPNEALTLLRNNGKKIVSACTDAETYYYDADLKSDIALLIGNEGGGLSKELIEGADVKVKIPMEAVDSLNAAVAAGILMYETKRLK
jgi:TrmH family RNA methyltransferase